MLQLHGQLHCLLHPTQQPMLNREQMSHLAHQEQHHLSYQLYDLQLPDLQLQKVLTQRQHALQLHVILKAFQGTE